MDRRLLLLLALGSALVSTSAGAPIALAATGPGSLVVTTVDRTTEAPVLGACLELWADAAGSRGTLIGTRRCDGPGKDGPGKDRDDLRDGVITFTAIPPGAYLLVETVAPVDATGSFAPAADQPVTVRDATVEHVSVTHQRTATLIVHTVDGSDAPLAGACFDLRGGKEDRVALCDGAGVTGVAPGDGQADGLLVMTRAGGLTKGPYTLRETRPPDGYPAAADRPVTISATAATEITVVNELTKGASLVVTTVDRTTEAPVLGACLELWTDAAGSRGTLIGTRRCDGPGKDGPGKDRDDLRDGVITFTAIPPGAYLLVETVAPVDATGSFAPAADQPVTLADRSVERTSVPHVRVATLTLLSVDPSGVSLPGACFELRGGGKSSGAALCDGPGVTGVGPGDGRADGLLVFTRAGGLEKGSHSLRETRAPDGYPAVADQVVTISATAGTELTVTHDPPKGASLVVGTIDALTERPLTGACLELWTDAGGSRGKLIGARRCDGVAGLKGSEKADDGLSDGVIAFTSVPAGAYLLVETQAPTDVSGMYAVAADKAVVLADRAVTRALLPHQRTATLIVRKVDGSGAPLAGACFELLGGKTERVALCDGAGGSGLPAGDGSADGLLVMTAPRGLGKGRHTLREIRPPDGYPAGRDQTVTISATGPTEITVVNRLPTAGGGGPGGTPIIALDLVIDSTITLTSMTSLPVDGVATAVGTIRLDPGPSGDSWSGKGTLTSQTRSKASGCPSMRITGEGTYDWVVRSVTAKPGGSAADIVVNMDSGPEAENPDAYVADMCTDPFEGVMNTWENVFFTVHRADYRGMGFEVRGWTADGSADAWTAGGPIAIARWTGDCTQPLLAECRADTTFRLVAVVVGTRPAPTSSADPNAAESSPPDGSPLPSSTPAEQGTAEPSGIVPAAPGAIECGDIPGCLTDAVSRSNPIVLIAAVVAATAAVVGAALLLRGRGRGSIPRDVPGSRLDPEPGEVDPRGGPVDLSTSPASGDKWPPDGQQAPPGPDAAWK